MAANKKTSSSTHVKALKDPKICRVFVSSPFRGIEKEREELVRNYFPQLNHVCKSHGVQFVAVDMRWGITDEAQTNAQVVNICLREVERSDIFVGFYGQRYGWHGREDEALQKNIENAMGRYSWLSKYRDRSVTELEFIAGHLNKPGDIPAIMAFRDKSYDEREQKSAEKKGDKRTVEKFIVESKQAEKMLNELKSQVIKTKTKCVALKENYTTPEVGAKFIYDELRKYIESALTSDRETSSSKTDLDNAAHEASLKSKTVIYVGGEKYFKELDTAFQSGKNVLVVGSSGCGKGALLANYVNMLRKRNDKAFCVVHFIGCSSDSANITDILIRFKNELESKIIGTRKSRKEILESMDADFKPESNELSEFYREFELMLHKAAVKRRILLVIDGLGKVDKISSMSKTLFWLPIDLPKNVTVFGTCREEDSDVIETLQERGYRRLNITPLAKTDRQLLCKQLLTMNSKELSASQLSTIVDCPQTGKPLYLRIVISELCAFGKYRELTEKIESLIKSKSVNELFQTFLRRLEEDYITNAKQGNIIEQVLCSLCVSRRGLSENELMAMHKIPSSEWSPLFFAMQPYMVEATGLIRFGFVQLKKAVEQRYLLDKNTKLKYQKIVVNYFENMRKSAPSTIQLDDPTVSRPAEEVPWLMFTMGDKQGLMNVLGDLSIFSRLFMNQEFDLVQLWRATGLSGDKIADIYIKAIQERTKSLCAKTDQNQPMVKVTILTYLSALSFFMELASYTSAQEKILKEQLRLTEESASSMSADALNKSRCNVKLKLAFLFTEMGKLDEAEVLHSEVLEMRKQQLHKAKKDDERLSVLKGLGTLYHGMAMLKSKRGQIDQAIEYYTKAMEVQKELKNESEVADSLHNMGVMYMKLGQYQKALEILQKSMEIYDDMYFANMPPLVAVMITNVAVCHRNLGQEAEAEQMYNKAIGISEKAMGRDHPHVASSLLNLGTLEINRGDLIKAEQHIREAKQIFEKCEINETSEDFYALMEKFVYVLFKTKKDKESVEHFKKLYQIAKDKKYLDKCWPNVFLVAAQYFFDKKDYKVAHDVSLSLLESKQSHEKFLILYNDACKQLKSKPKADYDISKQSKSPVTLGVVRNNIEKNLIPAEDGPGICKALDEADLTLKIGQDLYGTAIMWCRQAKKEELELFVIKHSANMFPKEINFQSATASKLYQAGKWEDAKTFTDRLVVLQPSNLNFSMMHGDLLLRLHLLREGEAHFNKMLKQFSSNQAAMKQIKDALEMIKNAKK